MRATTFIALMIALCVSVTVTADELSVPPVITSGLAAYQKDGAQAAIKAWLKASPLEGSKEALSQANMLNQIHDFYGPYRSYEIVQVHTISASSKIVYLTIDCEKGAIFGRFLTFRQGDVWVVPSFKFNTEPDQLLPYSLLAH